MKDVIIIGGGPAGIQASLVAQAKGLDVLIIERNDLKGQVERSIQLSKEKEANLLKNLVQQVETQAIDILKEEVISASLVGSVKHVKISSGEKLECKTVIIASGKSPDLEDKKDGFLQIGSDVIDSENFKDANVFIYGENPWLKKEVSSLLAPAKSITLLSDLEFDDPKVNSLGQGKLLSVKEEGDGAKISYEVAGKEEEVHLDKPYVLLSYDEHTPNSSIYIRMDLNDGYIETSNQVETNIPGVFAAGDIREKEQRTIDSALIDGKAAALAAAYYLSK